MLQVVSWTWILLLCLVVPECLKLLASVKLCMFKPVVWPSLATISLTLVMEGLHASGCALMTFGILPELNVVRGAMLANCVFFVPALLRLSYCTSLQSTAGDYRWKIANKVIALLF
ncbi:hypothetical protein BIW11_10914, partial [Tropilaelaps mercedesae]